MALLSTILSPPPSPFDPSFLYTIFLHPLTALLSNIHRFILFLRGPSYRPSAAAAPTRIVCISDTHSKIPPKTLPPGDLLIHCGDLTDVGSILEIQRQIDWLKTLLRPDTASPGYQHIVVICGNHDSFFDTRSRSPNDRKAVNSDPGHPALDWGDIHYLEHSSATLTFSFPQSSTSRTLHVFGAPQIPKCGGKDFAFQYLRGQDAWSNTIPPEVDVLVTHTPPKWHLDLGGLGDEFLLRECWRTRPTLHVFGHVHAGYGRENMWWDGAQRAWEAVAQRGYKGGTVPEGVVGLAGAFVRELLDVRLWSLGLRMVFEDIKGLVWTRAWGGGPNRGGGWMINAALTFRSTGVLGNDPQVVIL